MASPPGTKDNRLESGNRRCACGCRPRYPPLSRFPGGQEAAEDAAKGEVGLGRVRGFLHECSHFLLKILALFGMQIKAAIRIQKSHLVFAILKFYSLQYLKTMDGPD